MQMYYTVLHCNVLINICRAETAFVKVSMHCNAIIAFYHLHFL